VTRVQSGTRAAAPRRTSAAIAKPTGQLVWAGAPPGGMSFELYQAASGTWQMFLINNSGGAITRTIMGKREPELMQFFQIYLQQHPPIRLANRSVRATTANTIPASQGVGTNSVAVKRATRRRVAVTRSTISAAT